jgi:hypothetical protein
MLTKPKKRCARRKKTIVWPTGLIGSLCVLNYFNGDGRPTNQGDEDGLSPFNVLLESR